MLDDASHAFGDTLVETEAREMEAWQWADSTISIVNDLAYLFLLALMLMSRAFLRCKT